MNQAVFASTRPARQPLRLTLQWLLDELVDTGLVTFDQTRRLEGGSLQSQHPLVVAASQDWDDPRRPGAKLTIEVLTQWLAERAGIPYQRIDPLSTDVAKVTTVMPYAYASRAKILPIKVTASDIVVAVTDPFVRDWVGELEPALKLPIQRVLANPQDIERYLVEFYALARSVKASQEERTRIAPVTARNLEQLTELGRAGKLTAEDQHVVAIVDWLLQYAFESRASDIHLEPRRDSGNVRFRIDGVLHEVYQMPASVMVAVTSRIKILSRMDVAEKRKPQDGRIKMRTPEGKEIELRVSSLPTAFGEKMVLRIFNPEVLVRDFGALGFAPDESMSWRSMIEQPHGIVLVTGPTGSGKTTTLYSSLKMLATSEVNVCTIEDPIELIDASFNQMQVQPNIELDFADGVRALLRQDPDIIMVGEIRDLETAEVAVQAALTGHLVLSTLHTNDAPSAITRMIELGVPAYLLRATLIGVLAQRLVRRLCPHCKSPAHPFTETWDTLIAGADVPKPDTLYEPSGCLECRQTGFLGRTGLYELMTMTPAMRSLLRGQPDLTELRTTARADGLRPLRVAGAMKIAAGLTSIGEVLSLTPSPHADA